MKGRLPPKAATIRCVMQGQEALPGDRTPVLQKDYFAQQPDEILIFSFSSLVHKSPFGLEGYPLLGLKWTA